MTARTLADYRSRTTTAAGARRAHVAVAGRGRHLFDTLHDDRVVVSAASDDAPDADIVIFSCESDRRFDRIREVRLPERLRTRIADGAVGLVFDASTEGVRHKPDITESLHRAIGALGASPLQCVYITQERNFGEDHAEHCAATGSELPVAVLNHDYWIWKALEPFERDGERVYRDRLQAFRSRGRRRSRRFVSLNRTPRPVKILFLLSLFRDGLWDAGFISFGGFAEPGRTGKPRPTPEQLARALPGFEDRVRELSPWMDALDRYGRVLLGLERHGWTRLDLSTASIAADLPEYDESWFSAVTETEMRGRRSRITEKVIKPLVNFHPLLVLGNPGSLALVRSYGFVTFDDIFDESYDEELNPRKRFDLVYQQVARLCRADENDLRKIEAVVAEKLRFNAYWGLTQFPGAYRRERDAVLIDELLALVGRPPACASL